MQDFEIIASIYSKNTGIPIPAATCTRDLIPRVHRCLLIRLERARDASGNSAFASMRYRLTKGKLYMG